MKMVVKVGTHEQLVKNGIYAGNIIRWYGPLSETVGEDVGLFPCGWVGRVRED